jgi:hypothetical protein
MWLSILLAVPGYGQPPEDQVWVASGRHLLEQKNLAEAHTHFSRALAVNPDNPDANVFQAATALLLLPRQGPGASFLNRLGVSSEGRDLYNWTADFRRDNRGDIILPGNLNSEEAINLYRNEVVPLLQAAQRNLARVADTQYQLHLTEDELQSRAITVDWGDLQVVRAMLWAGEFLGHTLNAHNFKGSVNRLFDLGKRDQLTVQRFLRDYPSFLKSNDAASLRASQISYSNAVVNYVIASEFIRNPDRRPVGAQRLFTLEVEDFEDEAQFRNALMKTLVSTQRPVKLEDDDDYYIFARPYFEGTRPLRDLIPKFKDNYYLSNSLPSYTFYGIAPGLPPATTEMFLRERLGPSPYSGFYDCRGLTTVGAMIDLDEQGLRIRIAGIRIDFGSWGVFGEARISKDGTWSQRGPDWEFSGRLEQGRFSARYRLAKPGYPEISFYGKRQPDTGAFRGEAGLL